ncbi:glycosyltransferase [Actinacidiphila alni]|uniref:glycosyltransferase n=1 Tax=Actinacidiphila alni TaxID=380248 RepID=UPI0034566991
MRVLHIVTGLGIGGAEQQLRLLVRHLPATCENDVVTLTNPGPVADGLRADGVRVTHLGMGGNRDLAALPRLTSLIRAGRYDVVHTHLYRACVYGRIAARLAGVRAVVATEHSLGDSQIEGRPLTRGTRALYRGTERLGVGTVAVSATVARRLREWGVPEERIHVVPNGIDPDRFRFDPAVRAAARARLGFSERTFVIGGVGRLVPGKNVDVLVRALPAVPAARLLIVGTGPEHDHLLRLARSLGVAPRVHLVGAAGGRDGAGVLPELPALLAAMDVFVSASREESFGLAMVEALAAGLPVLHMACPAIEDLPPAAAPGARRIGTDVRDLVAALHTHYARHTGPHAGPDAGARRLPVPAAVDSYHIARTAERVHALYAAATGTGPGPDSGAHVSEDIPAVTASPAGLKK